MDNTKVAIISYNINSELHNYGAALHSWAFQQYLKMQGVDSVIIDYYPKAIEEWNLKFPVLHKNRPWSLKYFVRDVVNWGGVGLWFNYLKYKKFEKFFDKNTVKTRYKYHQEDLLTLLDIEGYKFNIFVCESDVIWKIGHNSKFDDVFLLKIPCAEKSIKVAYSPSLSSKSFTKEQAEYFMSNVKDFKAISTRERQGAEYLSQLLGRRIDWVLDPTLLLDEKLYLPIITYPKEKGYVLVYNCMTDDLKMLSEARRFAKSMGKKLIEISNYNMNRWIFHFSHQVKTAVGVEEFLGYVKNADFVICNAFHGMCFSVVFKKQFFLFQRDVSDFRMQNITEALGLQSRLVSPEKKKIPHNYSNIDYEEVYVNLERHRKRSYKFIEENIVKL